MRQEWTAPATDARCVLVQLLKVGVDPALKAAALRTLRAFAQGLEPAAGVPPPGRAPSASGGEVAAEVIWRMLAAPVMADPAPPGAPPSEAGEFELLAGLKKDLEVEQRHQEYPETLAFIRLIRQLLSSCADAARSPPPGITRHMAWVGEELFCNFEAYGFRDATRMWELAAGCLASMVQATPCQPHSPNPPGPGISVQSR